MANTQKIATFIDNKEESYIHISDQLWDFAETRFEEKQSAELLCRALEEEGFTVEKGIADMETAFIGSFGSGKPVVAILGEYDALPCLSQKKGVASEDPIQVGGNGHGCGHNLLGTGSFAAAVAVKQFMEEEGLSGTVRYYGCPAEEGGSGKTFMVRDGVFDDVDFAICWHPSPLNGVLPVSSLANTQVYFKFLGRSSHAAITPHLGRSALDAVELTNVGVNYLREHIIPEARVHYAITNTGGISPNVVQAEAEVLYLIRAPRTVQVNEIYERVCDIARGAALMTGTKVEIVIDKACSNLIPNTTLEKIMHKQYIKLGIPQFNEEEEAFAADIQKTLSAADMQAVPFKMLQDKVFADFIIPNPLPFKAPDIGSTDVGDVSWVVPTVQCTAVTMAVGTPLHTWQLVAQGGVSIGHKGMLHAAKVMAATAIEVMENTAIIEAAKKELEEKLEGQPYVSPIPAEVKPGDAR